MNRHRYSVALCTYNGERYIQQQIASILSQTIPPDEIIISDDGSTDNTRKIIYDLMEGCPVNIRFVSNIKSKGVTSNFCNAISLCINEIIFTSDQDDVWIENKAETILSVFENNNKAQLVFTNGELVDEDLNYMGCSMWDSIGLNQTMIDRGDWFNYLIKRCLVTGATMAFKKELFNEDEDIPSCWLHDGWLAWKAVAKNGLVCCNKKLLLYRQHDDNVIGMDNSTSLDRVYGYLSNYRHMRMVHINRYERYQALLTSIGDMFSEDQKCELQGCVEFWNELRINDDEKNVVKKAKNVIMHWIKGDFNRYSNGNRGAFRELLLSFVN